MLCFFHKKYFGLDCCWLATEKLDFEQKECQQKFNTGYFLLQFGSTQRIEPSHSFTSKPFQSPYGKSQISAVNSKTSSTPTVQQSRPSEKSVLTPPQRILLHLQSDVKADNEINHGVNLRRLEPQAVRKLESAGLSFGMTMNGLVSSPQSTTTLISTHQQPQFVTQAIQQRKEVSLDWLEQPSITNSVYDV